VICLIIRFGSKTNIKEAIKRCRLNSDSRHVPRGNRCQLVPFGTLHYTHRLTARQVISSAWVSPFAKQSTATNSCAISSKVVKLRLVSNVARRRESPNSSWTGLRASVTPSVISIRSSPGSSCVREAAAGRSVNKASGSPVATAGEAFQKRGDG
jgi:hypothetical protein